MEYLCRFKPAVGALSCAAFVCNDFLAGFTLAKAFLAVCFVRAIVRGCVLKR